MRNYKILLISFVLLIFMIGAVSAASNSEAIGDDGAFEEDAQVIIVEEEDVDDPGSFIPDVPVIIVDDDDEPEDSTSNIKEIYVNDTGDDSNTGSAQSPYATIGKAIADVNASNVATIHLSEGTFGSDGDSNFQIQLLQKSNGGSLTIIGAGADKTFVDGQSAFRFATFYYNTNVTLKDISFINFKQSNGGAIMDYGTLTIENCIFKDIYSTGNQGGAIHASDNNAVLTVKNSSFISCSANGNNNWQAGGGAIFANNIASLTLENNKFIATSIVRGSGVAVYSNSKSYIDGNKFINLTGSNDASIFLNSQGSTVINNEFINCSNPSTTYSIVNLAYGSYTIKNNTFTNSTNSVGNIYATGSVNGLEFSMDNEVIDINNAEINSGVDVLINCTDDMGNIVKTTQFSVNFVNENNSYTFSPSVKGDKFHINFNIIPEVGVYNVSITCGGTTTDVLTTADIHYSNEVVDLYVDPEGSDSNNGTEDSPFATIQHAIDTGFDKSFNVVIHMAKGTYSGVGNVDLRIANKGNLQILGEAYAETIIDGSEESGFMTITSTKTTIKNLKFINGYGEELIYGGTLIDCIMDSNDGEGSSILNNANIDNLTFTNNKGYYSINNVVVTVNNSYFANNLNEYGSAGAIWIQNWMDPISIENCKFINNTAGERGGALYSDDAVEISITNCYFEGNYAPDSGAMFIPAGVWCRMFVENTTFINNKAESNGVFGFEMEYESFQSSALKFTDCKFINNSATKAGVATLKVGIFEDCKFINNSADYGGVFALLPYDIEPEEFVYIDPDEEETITSLELTNVIFENNIAKVNGNDIFLEEKNGMYWNDDYMYQYVIPLTITFNDLNVTSLVDDLTANVTVESGAVIGSAYDLTFELNGAKIGSAKIINGVATFTYSGFEDGEYVLSGNSYMPNSENVINDGTITVKLENVLSHVEFWVSPEGSDEEGNGSESNPFKSISHALGEATKNCRDITIHIAEGTYSGDLNTKLALSSMNNITLIGAGADKTVIDGEDANYFATITEGKNKIVMSDLAIKNMLPSNVQLIGNSVNQITNVLNQMTAPITVDEGANLYLSNVEITNCRGGTAIIVNNGNIVIDNSSFTNNGLSTSGVISGGNVAIDNSVIESNVAASGVLTDVVSLRINNSVIKNNFNLEYFILTGHISMFNGGFGLSTVIENTVISNDGDNSSLSVIGYDGIYDGLCPAISLAGSVIANNISIINNYGSPLKEYAVSYWDGAKVSPFGYAYGSGAKNVSATNSTFVNMDCIWAVNTYGHIEFDIDNCVFYNLSKIAYSFTPGLDSQYNITNSVFINAEPVIDRHHRSDRDDPNCNFNNNYWGSNDKPVITFINPGRADSFEPETWIVLYSEDEINVTKNVTDGENSTAYNGNAPIRTDYADNNGALDYAVVFGPVGYLFTTDDETNVIFDPEDAMYPFEAADPMNYRTPSFIIIEKINGSGAIFGGLYDMVGNPIENATILYNVSDVQYNTTTDADGKFVALGGNGLITLVFEGDDYYFDALNNITLENVAPVKTQTSIDLKVDGNLAIEGILKDVNGNPLANTLITYVINGTEANVTTDDKGIFSIQGANNETIEITYVGDDSYLATSTTLTLENIATTRIATVIEADYTFTRVANDYSAGERGDFFYATLKDINGNPISNVTCYVAVNGPIYNVTTDENGKFGVQVNLAAANTYTYALSFLGNEKYEASLNCSKLVLTAKKTTITAKAKAFKAKAKAKTISVTLSTVKNPYDGKTYLKAGKKLTMKLNGKTYTAKINAKGVAKFTIKLTKKGKYTAKITFAGDKTYKASSKSIKVTIK